MGSLRGELEEWEEMDRELAILMEIELSGGCSVWGQRSPGCVQQSGNGGITWVGGMACQGTERPTGHRVISGDAEITEDGKS